MQRFGEKLKAAREKRGVTLDAISKKTRVSVRLLNAIETERFDLLPGGVFNVSFIRQYCRAVGLDEEEIVAEFNEVARPAELEITETAANVDQQVLMQERGATLAENVTDYLRRYGRATAIGFAAICAAAAFFWFYPIESNPKAEPVAVSSPADVRENPIEEAAAAEVEPDDAADAPEVPGTQPQDESPMLAGVNGSLEAESKTGSENKAEAAPFDPAKSLHVEISITAKVWVQAVADGVRVFEDILEPGVTRSIEASDSVRLVVGNAAGLTVALNGKVLPPIGPSGHVRRVTLTSSGMEIDRIEPNRPSSETAAPLETRNGAATAPALAIAKPER